MGDIGVIRNGLAIRSSSLNAQEVRSMLLARGRSIDSFAIVQPFHSNATTWQPAEHNSCCQQSTTQDTNSSRENSVNVEAQRLPDLVEQQDHPSRTVPDVIFTQTSQEVNRKRRDAQTNTDEEACSSPKKKCVQRTCEAANSSGENLCRLAFRDQMSSDSEGESMDTPDHDDFTQLHVDVNNANAMDEDCLLLTTDMEVCNVMEPKVTSTWSSPRRKIEPVSGLILDSLSTEAEGSSEEKKLYGRAMADIITEHCRICHMPLTRSARSVIMHTRAQHVYDHHYPKMRFYCTLCFGNGEICMFEEAGNARKHQLRVHPDVEKEIIMKNPYDQRGLRQREYCMAFTKAFGFEMNEETMQPTVEYSLKEFLAGGMQFED